MRVCLLLLVVCSFGCSPAAAQNKQQPASAAEANGPLEVVLTGSPVRKPLKLISTQPARIEPIEQTPLHSKLAGYVEAVHVDYGDRVKAGQPLVKLAVPELEIELLQKEALIDQAKAEVLQAKSTMKAAEAAAETAKAGVAEAEARIARTDADIRRWRSEFARFEELAAGGAVNQQLVDETQQKLAAAEAARAEADAAVTSAKASALQAQSGIDKAAADVVAAEARQRVAEANARFTQTMLAYREISSPLAGVVTRRSVDPGYFVQPPGGQAAPLMVVARTDIVRVFVSLPEAEAAYVDVGDPATIEVTALRGAEFTGQVTRTSFTLDAANRSLETIIDLDNKEARLKPGMFAMIRITLDEKPDALTLPAAAVVRQGKEAFCYRLIGGKATKTPIELGIRVGDEFEITGGLSTADQVILNKAQTLKDAQPVRSTN